ncbi:hypothetical protein FN846DRAFT_1019622, partial [Sphaerosporella brunnea]
MDSFKTLAPACSTSHASNITTDSRSDCPLFDCDWTVLLQTLTYHNRMEIFGEATRADAAHILKFHRRQLWLPRPPTPANDESLCGPDANNSQHGFNGQETLLCSPFEEAKLHGRRDSFGSEFDEDARRQSFAHHQERLDELLDVEEPQRNEPQEHHGCKGYDNSEEKSEASPGQSTRVRARTHRSTTGPAIPPPALTRQRSTSVHADGPHDVDEQPQTGGSEEAPMHYTAGPDPRYYQLGGFSGPSYPMQVPPQHMWGVPRGLTAMYAQPCTDYPSLFTVDGHSLGVNIGEDRFGYRVLPNSRGAFIKPIPVWSTLESILENVAGGALERVDFHEFQGRTCCGIFFISAHEAMKFVKYCKAMGGIYWAGCGIVSRVEAIPRSKGGHEPIKLNVGKGIFAGATRCLRVRNLPNNVDIELLKAQVKNQSSFISAQIESLCLIPENSTTRPTFTAILRMATIGTALGARMRLRSLRYYHECDLDFLHDPSTTLTFRSTRGRRKRSSSRACLCTKNKKTTTSLTKSIHRF